MGFVNLFKVLPLSLGAAQKICSDFVRSFHYIHSYSTYLSYVLQIKIICCDGKSPYCGDALPFHCCKKLSIPTPRPSHNLWDITPLLRTLSLSPKSI